MKQKYQPENHDFEKFIFYCFGKIFYQARIQTIEVTIVTSNVRIKN